MKKLLMMGALAMVMAAPAALAQDEQAAAPTAEQQAQGKQLAVKSMLRRMFENDDANGDGKITEEEFLAAARTKFAKMDANSDGSITPEELKAKGAEKMKKLQQLKEERAKDGSGDAGSEGGETSATPETTPESAE